MFYLPEQADYVKFGLEKIDTYLLLSKLGCPVIRSVVIMPDEEINQKMICNLHKYFKTDEVTVRYQYIRPSIAPIPGGNRYSLSKKTLKSLQNMDTLLWILEPINRLKNDYGINLHFYYDCCIIEIVGKGFDVSDLNRGQVSPQQSIMTELPVRWGQYNEWWKFLKYSFLDKKEYELSKYRRTKKLLDMGYSVCNDIFNVEYQPLSLSLIEELLHYISIIHNFQNIDDYCVSCTIDNGHFIFWDIQTPDGKKNTYGVK